MKEATIGERVKYTDSRLISILRWFAWISAAIISAAINVWFLSQLGSHFYEAIIFSFVSIVLECGKLSSILRANIFNALSKKVDVNRIKRKRNSSYAVYAAYAVFAVICAASLSINLTTTNISSYDSHIALLEQQKANILVLQEPLQMSEDLIRARDRYEELQELFLTTNREDDALQFAYRTRQDRGDGTTFTWSDSNASAIRLRSVKADRDEAEARWSRLLETYDRDDLARREQLAAALKESGTVFDIDVRIGQLKVNKAMNAGSAQIFITLGEMFKFDPNVFRLVILMFLAILIEYLVFSLAPTSKVNRKLLYDYREYIPRDTVVKILQEFDDELELYLGVKATDPKAEEKLHAAELTIEKLMEKPVKVKRPKKPKAEEQTIEEKPLPVPQTPKIKPEKVETVVETVSSPQVLEQEISEQNGTEVTHLYRYGRSNEKIRDKFKDFMMSVLPENSGRFVVTPDDGARMSGISNRLRDVFMKRLSQLKMGGRPLVYEEDGRWYSSHGRDPTVTFATEIVD